MRLLSFFFLLLCLLLAGCGGGTLQVSGTIAFPDKSPLTQGTVVFASNTYIEKSTLDSNGRYKLNFPPDQYRVYIVFASVKDETFVPPPNDPDALRYIDLIHPSFTSLDQTPLTCDITKSGTHDFTVELPTD